MLRLYRGECHVCVWGGVRGGDRVSYPDGRRWQLASRFPAPHSLTASPPPHFPKKITKRSSLILLLRTTACLWQLQQPHAGAPTWTLFLELGFFPHSGQEWLGRSGRRHVAAAISRPSSLNLHISLFQGEGRSLSLHLCVISVLLGFRFFHGAH